MKGFHKFLFDQGCPGYPFRDMIDNLTDDDILDLIEEYAAEKAEIKKQALISIDQVKEYVAIESGYRSHLGPNGDTITAWESLLHEIRGDTEIIEHYINIVADVYSQRKLES